PVAGHVDQGRDDAPVARARDDPRKPKHVRTLVAPGPAKVCRRAVVNPDRIAPERAGDVHAHGEVVDVRSVKERAAEIAARHKRVEATGGGPPPHPPAPAAADPPRPPPPPGHGAPPADTRARPAAGA